MTNRNPTRHRRDVTIDHRKLINEAAVKAGDIGVLADQFGYKRASLIQIRNNGLLSKRLERKLIEFIKEVR